MKHENVVMIDDRGIPSIMVRFEKPSGAAVPPMFHIGGNEVDAIYISKYPNKVINGKAYSLPMVDPTTNITFDEALAVCRAKGSGWHLMTAIEWEYLLDESRKLGTIPHGNTDWGKDYYEKDEKGITDGASYGRTLTGSGPVTWNHDHTEYGVSDMCGEVWEWLAGLRLNNGIIEFIANNDAAMHGIDLSADSKEWKRVNINGNPARFIVEDGGISISADDTEREPDYDGVPWEDLEVEDIKAMPDILAMLGLIPKFSEKAGKREKQAYVWIDTEGERLPIRGSDFAYTSDSGPSALYLDDVRSGSFGHIGFRSAFYEVNGKLITE